jgi:guanylate kinase
MKNLPLLLIVSSPSGAGKTTLCNRLLSEFADLRFSISHTTRAPRPNEVDGRDYHFVSVSAFEKMVEENMFIEWAAVHGNRYGTARTEVHGAAAASLDLIFDVDFQGARQIKHQYPGAAAVFVLPPSIEELHRRLKKRGTETPESLERRFKAALEEIGNHGLFDYIIVNKDIDEAYDRLRSILLAERSRHTRMADLADHLLADNLRTE